MSKQIQIRRGTTAEHKSFIGAQGEITMDTDKNTLRVHDGKTPGGTPLAREGDTSSAHTDMLDYVVAYQAPSAANNYTWYRKYKSGWIEQGGRVPSGPREGASDNNWASFLLSFIDTNYTLVITAENVGSSTSEVRQVFSRMTHGFNAFAPSGMNLSWCWAAYGF